MSPEPDSPPFRHVFLTRFNLRLRYGNETGPVRLIDDGWLRRRLDKFLRFTHPSVRSQTAPVDWVLYIDSESPRWFSDRLEALDGVTVAPIDGPGDDRAMQAALRRTGLVDRPSLITTRLDSDDAIARDYASSIQAQFRGQAREFLDFPVGCQLIGDRRLYAQLWRSNPFLSLIEDARDAERITSVFCMPHNRVLRSQRVRTLWRAPMWLQLVHGSNTTSGRGRWTVRLPGARPNRFACDWTSPAAEGRVPDP